jgi:hypothetical protein
MLCQIGENLQPRHIEIIIKAVVTTSDLVALQELSRELCVMIWSDANLTADSR